MALSCSRGLLEQVGGYIEIRAVASIDLEEFRNTPQELRTAVTKTLGEILLLGSSFSSQDLVCPFITH